MSNVAIVEPFVRPKSLKANEVKAYEKLVAQYKLEKGPKNQIGFQKLISVVAKETKLLSRIDVYKSNDEIQTTLFNIIKYQDQWLLPIEGYKSKSHNYQKQITTLLNYLYSKYSRPEFLNCTFADKTGAHIPLFLHIAQGGNIRKWPAGQALTKTQAHTFHTTPASIDTIAAALLRARILSYNVEDRYAVEILACRYTYSNTNFWNSFFEFLGRQSLVDVSQIRPLCDYLEHKRAADIFAFKGRSLQVLLQQMELWHKNLARLKTSKNRSWETSGITAFEYPHIDPKWTITEIVTEKELLTDGREMKHCVYSYVESCIRKRCSIWSLKELDIAGNKKRRATIEVVGNKINQARKAYNHALTAEDISIIGQWGKQADLFLSNYL